MVYSGSEMQSGSHESLVIIWGGLVTGMMLKYLAFVTDSAQDLVLAFLKVCALEYEQRDVLCTKNWIDKWV